jgi:hypothetical protein
MINGPIRDRKAEPSAFPSIGVAVVTVMPKWQSGKNDKFQIPKSRDTEHSQQGMLGMTLPQLVSIHGLSTGCFRFEGGLAGRIVASLPAHPTNPSPGSISAQFAGTSINSPA